MKVFLLDLWLDLREKRLAPVALLLLAAIVIVPIALANGGGNETTTTPAPTTTTTASAAPVIQTSTQAEAVDSKLQTFSPRDPFEPAAAAQVPASSTTTGTSGGGTSTSSSGSSGSSSSGTSTSTSGGGSTGTEPSTGTGTTTTGTTTPETKTTLFTYTVDLRFGERDSVKAYKSVKRLELIPDPDHPKVVFLGVTTTGKTAVFLVDSNIGVDTPGGKCRPSADECTFLYLRPDKDHDLATLTDSDGTVYHLRLSAIHRVTVTSSTGNSNSGSGNGNSNSKSNGNNRSNAFTGRADSNSDGQTTATGGDTPPGEPDHSSNFQQFFADGGN